MSRFVSRRFLIILAPLVLLIGVMVPFAAFAASPAHDAASSASNDPSKLFAINNNATCSGPGVVQTLIHLRAHDRVSGLAQVVSATDTTENMQEVLILKETNGPFTARIVPNSGTHSFRFTATRNGTLTACFQLLPGASDDENDLTTFLIDHPGAVFLTVTHHN